MSYPVFFFLCMYLDQFLFMIVIRLFNRPTKDGNNYFTQFKTKFIVAFSNTEIDHLFEQSSFKNKNVRLTNYVEHH